MQFLISVITDSPDLATPEEMAAIDVFNERLKNDGHWIFAAGLTPPSQAAVIDSRGAKPSVTAGALHDSEEFVAGFWLVGALDEATARELATEASKHCNRKVELRPLIE